MTIQTNPIYQGANPARPTPPNTAQSAAAPTSTEQINPNPLRLRDALNEDQVQLSSAKRPKLNSEAPSAPPISYMSDRDLAKCQAVGLLSAAEVAFAQAERAKREQKAASQSS